MPPAFEFETLPIELINHIACQTDTKSVLALASTSRKLRAITYVPITFRRLIAVRHVAHVKNLQSNGVERYIQNLDRRCRNTQSWARFSLAEETINDLYDANQDLDTRRKLNSSLSCKNGNLLTDSNLKVLDRLTACQWTLLTLDHPVLTQLPIIEPILDALEEISRPDIYNNLLPFIIAVALSCTDIYNPSDCLWDDLMPDENYWAECEWHAEVENEELNTFATIILLATLWYRNMLDDLNAHSTSNAGVLDFPRLSNIQLPDSLFDILPFDDLGKNKTRLQHIYMTVPKGGIEFLTSGDWLGCYTLFSLEGQCDALMRNVRFQRAVGSESLQTEEIIDNVIALQALNCSDECGAFQINISVSERTGRFRGKKAYDSGVVWPWSGALTAFGLVGYWGDESWGGSIWLWKTREVEIR